MKWFNNFLPEWRSIPRVCAWNNKQPTNRFFCWFSHTGNIYKN